MRLTSLSLDRFRSYQQLRLDLSGASLHCFVGENGSGKTNLLEAISVLSLSKSGLGAEDEHLIRWEESFTRVRGEAQTDQDEPLTLEVAAQTAPRRQKAFFRNDVKIGAADLVGQLPTALFLPQDLELFSGPPAERRRFLDQILCQVSPAYFQALTGYLRLLKQRNALLRAINQGEAREADLDPWDDRLAQEGSTVTVARLELLETFGLTLTEEVRGLGERWEDVRILYDRASRARDRSELTAELSLLLRQGRTRDLAVQATGVGPHRDDWTVTAEGRPLTHFASRGQMRTAVLALLFLEASFMELARGERPVVLLDDVFSELDERHQAGVLAAFAGHQVFLTGTHVPAAAESGAVWAVGDGTVVQR